MVKTRVKSALRLGKKPSIKQNHMNNGKLQQNRLNSFNGNGYNNQQSQNLGTPYSMNGSPNQNLNLNQNFPNGNSFAGGSSGRNQRYNEGSINYPDSRQNQYQNQGYENHRMNSHSQYGGNYPNDNNQM